MKSRYKRLLSFLLTLCMAFSLTTGGSAATFAEEATKGTEAAEAVAAEEVAEAVETEEAAEEAAEAVEEVAEAVEAVEETAESVETEEAAPDSGADRPEKSTDTSEKETFAALMADGVTYLDFKADGTSNGEQTCTAYTTVTSSSTAWGAADTTTWYVVDSASALTIANRVTVTGDVRLILKDGAELTASAGITVAGANSLTIYAQSDGDGMGRLEASGYSESDYNGDAYITRCGAGIGGESILSERYDDETEDMVVEELGAPTGGTVTICGGAVVASGGDILKDDKVCQVD